MSKNLLFKMSGSIAAYKSAHIASRLAQNGWQVQVVLSPSAERFVGGATFEGLTGLTPLTDLWQPGEAMAHINLDRWADVILLCPATANTINKMAAGIGDTLLTNLFLAHDFAKPYFIAPAMNSKMWSHPTTKKSVVTLKQMGLNILSPEAGPLACGEQGSGRLIDPDKIIELIRGQEDMIKKEQSKNVFEPVSIQNDRSKTNGQESPGKTRPKRILVTMGGTEEPIDGVRVLSNSSTGKTGFNICAALRHAGFQVTALVAQRSVVPVADKVLRFQTVDDLENHLEKELQDTPYDAVVHCAAISDFKIDSSQSGKKMSSKQDVTLKLVPREKTLTKIRGWSSTQLKVLAFKLTVGSSEGEQKQIVDGMLDSGHPDAVLANDMESIGINMHKFQLITKTGKTWTGQNREDLCQSIVEWIDWEHQ